MKADQAEKKVAGIGRASTRTARESRSGWEQMLRAVRPIGASVDGLTAELRAMRVELRQLFQDLNRTGRGLGALDDNGALEGLNRDLEGTRASLVGIENAAASAAASMGSLAANAPDEIDMVGAPEGAVSGAATGALVGASAAAIGSSAGTASMVEGLLTASMGSIGTASREMSDVFHAAMSGMGEVSKETAIEINRVQSMLERFAQAGADIERVRRSLDMAMELQNTEEAIERVAEAWSDVMNMEAFVVEPGNITARMDELVEKIRASSTELSEAQKAQIETLQTLSRVYGEQFDKMGNDAKALASDVLASMEKLQTGVGDAADTWADDLDAAVEETIAPIRRHSREVEKLAEIWRTTKGHIGRHVEEIPDKIRQMARETVNDIQRIDSAVKNLGNRLGRVTGALRSMWAQVAGALGLYAVVGTIDEAEKSLANLSSTLASTGNIAGFTMSELGRFSSALQQQTTFSEQAIQQVQALMLTFTQVGRTVFPQATAAALDMATRFGTDLRSAAMQLGKALNDPIRGLSQLREVGVGFSSTQESMIKNFLAVGDVAAAQGIILQELAVQTQGAARAARDSLGGALTAAKNNLSDLVVAIGQTNGGTALMRAAFEGVNDILLWAKANIHEVAGALTGLGVGLAAVAAVAAGAFVASFGLVGIAIAAVVAGLVFIGAKFGEYLGITDSVIEKNGDLRNATIGIWDRITATFEAGIDVAMNRLRAFYDYFVGMFDQLITNIGRRARTIGEVVANIVTLDFSGAEQAINDGWVGLFDNTMEAAQKAYDDRVGQLDFETAVADKLRAGIVIGETGARVRAGETGTARGTAPPPPAATSTGTDPAETLRALRAEADAARRLAGTYGEVLAAKDRLSQVRLAITAGGDAAALGEEAAQLERTARASEEMQRQLELEAALRAIKVARGTEMYRQQEAAIRQEHEYKAAIAATQREIAAIDEVGRIREAEQAAAVQARAYEQVAASAVEATLAGQGQVETIARAREEAARQVREYENLVQIQNIGVSRESAYYDEAVRSTRAIQAKTRAQEIYNQTVDAADQITRMQREADEIRQIADAYRVSSRAGDEMVRTIERENFVRSLNLQILGEQGRALEARARQALNERADAEAYRAHVEASQGAFDEYRDTILSAADWHRSFSDVSGAAFAGIEDNIVSLVTTGKVQFAELATSLLGDMARIITRAIIMRTVMSFINPAAAAPLPGGMGSDVLNLAPMAAGAIIRKPTIMPTAYGPVLGGEQSGDAVLPLRTTNEGKIGVDASGVGGGNNININTNLTVPPGSTPEDVDKIGAVWQRHIRQLIDSRISEHQRFRGMLNKGSISG